MARDSDILGSLLVHVSLRLMQTSISKTIRFADRDEKTPKNLGLSNGGGHCLAVTPAAGHTGVSSLVWGGLQHTGGE